MANRNVARARNGRDQFRRAKSPPAMRDINRRRFVTTTSGGLLSAVGLSACGTSEPGPTGTVRVTIAGLTRSAESGGTVTITLSGAPDVFEVTIALPPSGFETRDVPVGDYTVEYAPPAGFTLAAGTGGPQTVTISEDQVTDVQYVVEVLVGTLTITVSGLDVSATSGGSAEVLRTDITGQTATIVQLPLSGSVERAFDPGTYRVHYVPPAGHVLAPGVANPQSLAVIAEQTTVAAFTVQTGAGSLRITVTGLAAAATNGGSATVSRTDVVGQLPTTVQIPVSGIAETGLPPGDYNIFYSPPSGHELLSGETNPQSVVVSATETAAVAYNVQLVAAAPGTLRLTVSGLDASATNGGSATFARTDVGGQSPIAVQIAVGGTLDTLLAAGDYRIDYTPPVHHVLEAGVLNPQNVTVTSNQLSTAAYTVVYQAPTGGALFESDWATALGIGAAALLDTGSATPWTGEGGSNRNRGIATAASLGLTDWPAANVYHVGYESGLANIRNSQLYKVGLGRVGPGDHRYYRFYSQTVWGDTHGNTGYEHGVEVRFFQGDRGLVFYRLPMSNGTWIPGFTWSPVLGRWQVPAGEGLPKHTTHRVEWHVAFVSATLCRAEVRIYDANGVLLLDEDDFDPLLGSATTVLGSQDLTWNSTTHAYAFDCMLVGTNGPTSNFAYDNLGGDEHAFYHGAVCIRNDDWCGPY